MSKASEPSPSKAGSLADLVEISDFVNKLPVGLLWLEYRKTKMSSSPVFS